MSTNPHPSAIDATEEAPQGIPQALWEANLAKEHEALDQGATRFLAACERNRTGEMETFSEYGSTLLSRMIEPVAEALKAWLKEAKTGKAGPRHSCLAPILSVGNHKLVAFHACKVIVDEIMTSTRTANRLAFAISEKLETEIRMDCFQEREPKYFRAAIESGKRRNAGYAGMRAALIAAANKGLNLRLPKWGNRTKAEVGGFLLKMCCEVSGLVEIKEEITGPKSSVNYVVPTEAALRWIHGRIDRIKDARPFHLPMMCPPRPWTNPYEGGYWVIPVTLVKKAKPAYLEELANSSHMAGVYEVLNALQMTAWDVNPVILSVLSELWETQAYDDVFMVKADPVLIPKYDESLPELQLKERRVQISQAMIKNKADVGKRNSLMQTLRVAKDMVGNPLWFPYALDFRGRIYPLPSHLSPQGDDVARGLLQFAKAKTVETQEQADWLAIHGANSWGHTLDKSSYDARLKWVREHEDLIILSASDPLANRQWMDAESPFQFLAFCLEWTTFLGEGLGVFQSRIPVGVDGTCSGLQHYSAILRDPVGGEATNLVPKEVPADIYAIVAGWTIYKVKKLAAAGDPMAQQWEKFGIDRGCAKRPVMTLPYGSTPFSAREYIQQWIDDKMRSGRTGIFLVSPFAASRWLVPILWESIGETVIAARAAMDWLHTVARIVAKTGNPVWWTAPTGFQVCQCYPNTRQRRVSSHLLGKRIFISYRDEAKGFDPQKAASGLAPNFVHSMDASALMLTVLACLDEGVDHFGMVHDSYACHAADMPKMSRILRKAFVDMYTNNDVLAQFEASVREAIGPDVELPPRPATGTLDLNLVLSSPYFFS